MKLTKILTSILSLALLLSATGCMSPQTPASAPTSSAPASSTAPQSPAAPSPGQNSASPSAQTSPSASPSSQPIECNWTFEVNDTQTAKINGYDFTCSLIIRAVKAGGKDGQGLYKGTASLKYSYKMAQGNVSGDASGNGQDQNATFDVVVYDAGKFVDSARTPGSTLPPLAPLTDCDGMAIGSLNMTGSGLAKESAGGANWATSDSKTVAAPYRMSVYGGQVTFELFSIAPGVLFHGMITGAPVK